MTTTLQTEVANVYQIERGGQARRVRGVEARRKIDRELHGVVIASTAHLPRVPQEQAHFFFDLRRGRRKLYGALLRYVDTCAANGTSKEVLLLIPRWIEAYIDDLYETPNPTALRKVA